MKSTRIDVLPTGGGTFEAHLVVEVQAPWNKWAADPSNDPNGTLNALWYATAPVPAWCASPLPAVGLCQYNQSDHVETYVRETGLTCAGAPYNFGSFSVQLQTCAQPCNCQFSAKPNCICGPNNTNATWTDVNNLPPFVVTKVALGCLSPPKEACNGDESCPLCKLCGSGGASAAGGGASAAPPNSGPGATLRYRAGGVGGPGFPGTAAWRTALGRYWSHDHAERIVLDPDVSHVWLLTRFATFREFRGLASGSGLRTYAIRSPSDEYRRLSYDTASGGWQLQDLEGGVQNFLSSGLWDRTLDRNGNTTQATYSGGNLSAVTFPDGRSETYTYQPGGKLATLTETGVGGGASRLWTYTWSGDDLSRIDRPDGTALEFQYGDARFPGSLTRMDVVATDFSRRVETAWQYDTQGNVQKIWRGDPVSTGPNAVDLYRFTFDNLVLPAKTTIMDPLGNSTIVTLARDTSNKPKVTQLEGDCPTCGVGPNAQMTYADAGNPLLPTDVTDGRSLHTQYAYNADGRMTSKTEAAGTPLARTTTWQYSNALFPGFSTRIDAPSTSGGAALRSTVLTYNATGDLTTQTIQGAENGSSFSYPTSTAYNTVGQPLSVDPPGHGTADVTSYTYDPARGNLLPLTRTDPLIGATTSFAYDAFNRRATVTDANGVLTVTAYDSLNRVTSVTQKGTTPAEDLVTTYSFNAFGDLFRTVLPRGNVIEYGYDPAGRLLTMERKPDAATHGERTLYTLDTYGHRIKEELQSWSGTVWVNQASTSYVYSTRCHLDQTVYPDGSVTENTYDCDGNLAQAWDANHPRATNPTPTQSYAYDSLNRLSAVTQPWAGAGGGSAVTSYSYDVQDHLNRVTDAEGNVTTYTYGDRDLMTAQLSPASGTTTDAYDAHGELTAETDARGVVTTRTLDALNRVTAITYPDVSLNTTYTYDDPLVPFSKGRLTRLARPDAVIDYRYDRFGRTLQDGELTYTWDGNGNPATIMYPGNVTAVYGYDFADRPASLRAQRPGKPDQLLVTAASYFPAGPLSSLALGNGLTETRSFTNRYLPSSISLSGTGNLLSWTYTTDSVGNIKTIADALNAANNRTYTYQDIHYFLTQGNGPWGPRSWTYDKIGNRLTETRGVLTDTYAYSNSTGGGHSPLLTQIQLGAGGTRTYQFGPAGHLEKVATGADATLFTNDAAGRLAALERTTPRAGTALRYDGRGFLILADASALPFLDGFETGDVCAWSAALGLTATPTCTAPPPPAVHSTYSSEGLLHALQRNAAPDRSLLFHFAGRPVAQLDLTGSTEIWKYLTADHLGTPIAATSAVGAVLWQGGFEPFGADWSGAGGVGMFLRLPGQWEDNAWQNGTLESLFNNTHRWYQPGMGRYSQPDPAGQRGDAHPYAYGQVNPVTFIDPFGQKSRTCCTPIAGGLLRTWKHCFIETIDETTGKSTTFSLHGMGSPRRSFGGPVGCTFQNDGFDVDAIGKAQTECGPWSEGCATDDCVKREFGTYPSPSLYSLLGTNSNTFAGYVTNTCDLKSPNVAGTGHTPGWGKTLPPQLYWPGLRGYPMRCPPYR